MSLAVRSKLRNLATLGLALSLACACLACDPSFDPNWHPALPADAGEPPPTPPGDAGPGPVDVGPGDAAMAPEQDAAAVPMYTCRIEYCDAGVPNCRTVCFAPSREVYCRPDQFCPYYGSDAVDCSLCMSPPIK